MLAPITHILPLTTIRRRRLLPVPGRVLVRAGKNVNPTDIVAVATIAPEHKLINVARSLGVTADEADSMVLKQPGEEIAFGDVIASRSGISGRVIRARSAGRVVAVGGGQVLLETESNPYELKAGIPGSVTKLVPDRGVIIETRGALVQGVWGNNRVDYGTMHVLTRSLEGSLTPDQMDVSHRGSFILAGYLGDVDTLQIAANLPIRGMILSSMSPLLVPMAKQMDFPIVIIEGFGQIHLNEVAYKLLFSNDKREISVNAETYNRFENVRPEIIIPLRTAGQQPEPREADIFAPGQQVRIVRAPHMASTGILVSLSPGVTKFPNGIRTQAAEVQLEDNKIVIVPLANLDVLE